MADPHLADSLKVMRETIADWSQSHSKKSEGYGPRALIVMAIFDVDLQESESGEYFWAYDPYISEHLHREALAHWDTFRMYSDIIASKIKCGVRLQKLERDFAARVLSGELTSPRKPKANKIEDNFSRNLLILACVNSLVEDHLIARFPSETRRSNKTDASTLVSEAFCQTGHHEVTPSAVKGVLQNKKVLSWVSKLEGARREPVRLIKHLKFQELRHAHEAIESFYAEIGALSQH